LAMVSPFVRALPSLKKGDTIANIGVVNSTGAPAPRSKEAR
jgi:hypothetical protein